MSLGSASPLTVASALKRPGTSYSAEKPNLSTLERLSVTAGCSRQLMESLNQRRPSLQRLHTPFRGSNRFKPDMRQSLCSNIRDVNESIFMNEFTAMQDRKLWENLLRFIDDISTSIRNEDLDQLHKILYFDQGNFPQSPSRFFRSEMTVQGNVYLGSGFGGEQASDFQLSDDAESRRPGEFRDILGEIFMFFENFFPAMRWDFKKQVEEEEALLQLSANHGKTIVASPKVFSDELVQEMQPAKLNARQMLQMKVEAERTERGENLRLLQEGKIKSMQQTPLQMRCINLSQGTYRTKNDGKKKIAWQKIQMEWKIDAARLALRFCDKVFEPSPRLKRVIEHHDLRRKADLQMAERPKTAPNTSRPKTAPDTSRLKSNFSHFRKAAQETQRFSELSGESNSLSDIGLTEEFIPDSL